jgi:hypothetical protein
MLGSLNDLGGEPAIGISPQIVNGHRRLKPV